MSDNIDTNRDNNNTSGNQDGWWRANFEEGDDGNRRVRQNMQYDAMVRGLDEEVHEDRVVMPLPRRNRSARRNNRLHTHTITPRNQNNTERNRAEYIVLTTEFDDVLGFQEQDDTIIREHEGVDPNTYDGYAAYEYYGTRMNTCFYCRDHLPISEVMSLFAERRVGDTWMVPSCDRCINPASRPCEHCLEVNCTCALFRNNNE